MPSCGKFSAWIEVDEERLPEFGLEISDDTSTVTCWVPSETGREFAVGWRDPNLQYILDGEVTIDGQHCGGEVAQYPKRKGDVTNYVDSVITGPLTSRALVFSKLELTDDDEYLQETSMAEHIGEIKLVLSEAIVTGRSGKWSDESKHFSGDMKLHERSKKGMGHRVGLGDELTRSSSKAIYIETVRDVATFIFRYRTLAVLQANGIAPIDRDAKRKASATPIEVLDDEDDKKNTAEIQALEARLRDLKGRQNKRVKTEVKAEQIPRSMKDPVIIDLTDD